MPTGRLTRTRRRGGRSHLRRSAGLEHTGAEAGDECGEGKQLTQASKGIDGTRALVDSLETELKEQFASAEAALGGR